MSNSIHDSSEEDIESLKLRVDTLLEGIDAIEDVDAESASTIAVAELGGATLCDLTRKFVILLQRKAITKDEHLRLVTYIADNWTART